jgi:hypothetical protein
MPVTVRSATGNGDAVAIGGDAAGRLVPSRQDEGINRVDEATAAYGGVNGGKGVRNRYLRNDRRDIAAAKGRSRLRTPVQGLASWFHQDFALMEVEPGEWGREFIRSLSVSQKGELKTELMELVATYPGKNGKGLMNAWIRSGAQSWPRSANLRQTIDSWVKELE